MIAAAIAEYLRKSPQSSTPTTTAPATSPAPPTAAPTAPSPTTSPPTSPPISLVPPHPTIISQATAKNVAVWARERREEKLEDIRVISSKVEPAYQQAYNRCTRKLPGMLWDLASLSLKSGLFPCSLAVAIAALLEEDLAWFVASKACFLAFGIGWLEVGFQAFKDMFQVYPWSTAWEYRWECTRLGTYLAAPSHCSHEGMRLFFILWADCYSTPWEACEMDSDRRR